jgi:succinylglutamate desuccinylase
MTSTLVFPSTAKKRIIGHIKGGQPGPTLVFFGGIHGNEPSGVEALQLVFKRLEQTSLPLKGDMYGIQGNIPALLKKQRYLTQDLNRLWFKSHITTLLNNKDTEKTSEELQLLAILETIQNILAAHEGPFYFIDFHTTSSQTLPFITINDAMINRKFSRCFPVPIILGIEEYLEGPLLSYVNEMGYVSLGFESGQHDSEIARENSIAFIWLSMVFSGMTARNAIPEYDMYYKQLWTSAGANLNFYEVTTRHAIGAGDSFKMEPCFKSFQAVKRHTLLAHHNDQPVYMRQKGMLFMPLYQQQGAEGFFIIRRIPKILLRLSAVLRKVKTDRLLTLLPGVSWEDHKKERLMVNIRVARFYSKAVFHLLGYRNRTLDKSHLLINNREKVAKNSMYKAASWF